MKAAAFAYHRPDTVAEAVQMLGEFGEDAKILAGGQSLVPMLAMRLTYFENLIDISRVDELKNIELRDDQVWIGAGTPHALVGMDDEVAESAPLLTLSTPYIGHFQIRTRGTLGGAIAHADPAAEYAAVALALDATMEATSSRGRREIPAAEFFTGLWETSLAPDEILTAVRFPVWGGRSGFAVEEFARRHGDFAIAGATVAVQLDDDDRVARCGIGLLGLGSTPAARFGRRGRRRRPARGRRHRRGGRQARDERALRHSRRPSGFGRLPIPGRSRHGGTSLDRSGPARPKCLVRRRSMHELPVEMTVNGRTHQGVVEPRLTLADFLREKCGLTGTHLGCEHGACGACTVLLDGQAVRSCLIFAVQVDGQEVTTVEGIAGEDGELSPVQSALRECHGLQCGFCTPGFVTSITALLRDNPQPTDEEIREGPVGQLLPVHRLPGHHQRGASRRGDDVAPPACPLVR